MYMQRFAVSSGAYNRARTKNIGRRTIRKPSKALAAAATAVSVGLLWPSAAIAATPEASGYQQTDVLHAGKLPPQGLLGDIVYADAQSNRLYFADAAKAEIDVWNTRTNRFLGAMTGGFTGLAGLPASFDHLGPDGVLVDNLGQIWAGNGDGTVKVGSTRTLAETHSIATGQSGRADELGYDPEEHVIIVTNPGDSPPRVTLINAVSHRVLGHVAIPNAGPNAIEQPQWDPLTQRFLVAVGATSDHPNGEIAVIDPRTLSLDKIFALTKPCSPAGLAIGPGRDALIGCASAGPIIVDRVTGALRASPLQACCGDEVWYSASDGRYYAAEGQNTAGKAPDPIVLVINARDRSFITKISLGLQHDFPVGVVHAVTAASGHVYVPENDGIHVFTLAAPVKHSTPVAPVLPGGGGVPTAVPAGSGGLAAATSPATWEAQLALGGAGLVLLAAGGVGLGRRRQTGRR